MANRVNKLEPYVSKYKIERSAYRINQDEHIVHLRMLSPDNGKTHVEYFSYIMPRGIQVLTTKIENEVIESMELFMHKKLGNQMGILEHKTKALQRQVNKLSDIENKIGHD